MRKIKRQRNTKREREIEREREKREHSLDWMSMKDPWACQWIQRNRFRTRPSSDRTPSGAADKSEEQLQKKTAGQFSTAHCHVLETISPSAAVLPARQAAVRMLRIIRHATVTRPE